MPYAPGVQDISGQLYARGMEQASQAYAAKVGGIANTLTDVLGQFQRNQMLNRQAAGKIAGLAQADPQFEQYLMSLSQEGAKTTPEIQKAVQNFQNNKADVYDMAMLSSLADTYATGRQEQEKRKMMAQQLAASVQQQKLIEQQTELERLKVQQEQADVDWYKQRAAAAQNAPANINQFISPKDVQGVQLNPAVVQFLGAQTGVSAGALPFAPQMAANAPQTAPGAISVAPMAAAAAPSAAMPTGLRAQAGFDFNAPWSPANPAGIPDLEQIRYEMTKDLPPRLRDRPDIQKKVEDIYDRRTKERERLMQAKEVMPSSQPRAIEGGKYLQTFDTRTGQPIGDPIPNPQHPEIAAGLAADVEEAKAKVQRAQSFNTNIADQAQVAASDLPRLRQIRQLYEQGAETGFAQEWINSARSAFVRLGIADADKVEKDQTLQSRLGEDALMKARTFLKGQGAVSEPERKRIDAIATNASKNPAANLELIRLTEMVYNKSIAAEAVRDRLAEAGKNERQIEAELRRWVISNPLEKFAVEPALATPSSAAAAPAAPARIRVYDPNTRTLR